MIVVFGGATHGNNALYKQCGFRLSVNNVVQQCLVVQNGNLNCCWWRHYYWWSPQKGHTVKESCA